MSRHILLAGGCAALTLLAACGAEPDLDNAGGIAAPAAEMPDGDLTAEQVAALARGEVKCPAKAASPRPAGGPVDDVVGVRPGMSWGEAAHFVMCDNPMLVVAEATNRNFSIETRGTKIRQGFEAKFAEPRIEKSGQDIIREMQEESIRRSNNAYEAPLEAGQSRYFVSTMGLPGQERVVSVAREEYYAADRFPTVDTIAGALRAKYGTPTQADDAGEYLSLSWKYDPGGRPITETSPLYNSCYIDPSPDGSTSLSPDCGVTVSARIKRSKDNRGLAHSLAVASQHGAQGYKRITDTEQALMLADQRRQADEVKDASQAADAPTI